MIYLGSDHRGYQLKEKIKEWLVEWEYQYQDLGNIVYDPEDDYPDFAKKVATKLQSYKATKSPNTRYHPPAGGPDTEYQDFGILVCGSGIGMDIVANKFPSVRCGLGFSVEQVKRGREEDDINCLALAADFISDEEAEEMVKVFLETKFLGREKYKRRLGKIKDRGYQKNQGNQGD